MFPTTGNGGTLNLNTEELVIERGGAISAATFSLGNSADVNLDVNRLIVRDGGEIRAGSFLRNGMSIREWICLNELCGKTHDRDEAASRNIRAEGIRIIKTDGIAVSEAWRDCKTEPRTKDQGQARPCEARNPILYQS